MHKVLVIYKLLQSQLKFPEIEFNFANQYQNLIKHVESKENKTIYTRDVYCR